MNNEQSVYIATGVWYCIDFFHKKYRHFPCNMQYDTFVNSNRKYISALENCKPIDSKWGADYDTLSNSKTRTTGELINLTKNVCNRFMGDANLFAEIELPMISMSMKRLIAGATFYQGREDDMSINNSCENKYKFIYSRLNTPVTPSNISDVLGKKIKHIHVVNNFGVISWDQESELNPNTPLYVYNYDKYEPGSVYAKILSPDTEIVNKNLHLISPKNTGHMPSQMAELFKQKTAPIKYITQSRNR